MNNKWDEPMHGLGNWNITYTIWQCSVIVLVVTAYDFESGCPGSNPEWGAIYYKASITAQGSPEPSSLRGSTLSTRAAEHKNGNWACKLTVNDWWLQPQKLCLATPSGICHRNRNTIDWTAYSAWVKERSINVSYIYIHNYIYISTDGLVWDEEKWLTR